MGFYNYDKTSENNFYQNGKLVKPRAKEMNMIKEINYKRGLLLEKHGILKKIAIAASDKEMAEEEKKLLEKGSDALENAKGRHGKFAKAHEQWDQWIARADTDIQKLGEVLEGLKLALSECQSRIDAVGEEDDDQ